ncbi:MAG: hypothetical protein IPG53_14585 [Ignavibacteriales bacterium]|nr:hypothetical protein [Ignavibacteriales bacterium]
MNSFWFGWFFTFSGCKSDDSPTNPATLSTKTMIMGYFGVDFQEGKVGDPETALPNEKIDGKTQLLAPNWFGGGWMTEFGSDPEKINSIGLAPAILLHYCNRYNQMVGGCLCHRS